MGANGTHHLQGYIEMPKSVRFSHFKGLEGAHFEKAVGSPQQCFDYCTKTETSVSPPFVYGTLSKGAGSRTDLIRLRDAVRDGKRNRELFDDDVVAGAAIKYQRGVAALATAYSKPTERGDVTVILHFGPPGTGKTYCAHSDSGMLGV